MQAVSVMNLSFFMIWIQRNPTATISSVWVSKPGHTGASRE